MAQFASLDDLKAHLNVTTTVDDDELVTVLDAAGEIVENLVGSFDAVAVTERVTATGGTVLLSRRPTGEVLLNDGDITGFTTSAGAGVLHGVPFTYEPLVATYDAGDGVVPASVALATLLIAAHLFETQRVPMQNDAPAGFGDSVSAGPVGAGYAIPNRALELLKPHMGVSIA